MPGFEPGSPPTLLPLSCPQEYFCALDQNGVRHDHARRPELNSCTIELVAPPEYMNRPCQDPAYLFALDVSAHAVRSGMLKAACAALREHVNALPGLPPRERWPVLPSVCGQCSPPFMVNPSLLYGRDGDTGDPIILVGVTGVRGLSRTRDDEMTITKLLCPSDATG